MTKPEAAQLLVSMLGMLQSKNCLDYSSKRQFTEAVTIACGELMVDAVLEGRILQSEEDENG